MHTLTQDAIDLLQQLIAIPSLSRQEDGTATCIEQFLQRRGVTTHRLQNNVWATNKHFNISKPTVLLNSHHDTVPANAAYTRDPHIATVDDGKLYGLGSTDAGASLVTLLAAFLFFYKEEKLPYNILIAASAEEEISGKEGIEKLFSHDVFAKQFSHPASFAIVGEPTQLQLAVAEKGLMVLECTATGRAGHAAREEGENALYKAIDAMQWFRDYRFEKVSPLLGPVKMTVTSVHTHNTAHNIVPAACQFVVDVRVNELYTHEAILREVRKHVSIDVKERSTRMRSSSIAHDHPVVKAGLQLGKKTYGSPTTSDKALIPIPALKCGPGFSGQSHSADEFVALKDIGEGVLFYIDLLQATFLNDIVTP
ncbi:MAG: M20/M25/M40 family metallo-hydrolase [Chitinophagaceae bacterium]|nr:MAG: M20/M25/M40 family metallo-hydrolase [Chitinophagaceae bacterium]